MVQSIISEANLRKSYIGDELVSTIYFGGGTPSLFDMNTLGKIINAINSNFKLADELEITLEANPDDLSKGYLKELKKLGINRLSIGIQSFNDSFLKFMNRAHNSIEAQNCLHYAREAGFENISLDLIYGVASEDHNIWENDLKKAFDFLPEHISCYCLTIEPKTVFGRRKEKGILNESEESFQNTQFKLLMQEATKHHYDHYEISNFCRDSNYSKHNTSYWKGKAYLGIGPGAHSFNGISRQWNISNNPKYILGVESGDLKFELEILSKSEQINEFIMTGIRTKWGVKIDKLISDFNYPILEKSNAVIEYWKSKGKLEVKEGAILLTSGGKYYADQIASDLFTADN